MARQPEDLPRESAGEGEQYVRALVGVATNRRHRIAALRLFVPDMFQIELRINRLVTDPSPPPDEIFQEIRAGSRARGMLLQKPDSRRRQPIVFRSQPPLGLLFRRRRAAL